MTPPLVPESPDTASPKSPISQESSKTSLESKNKHEDSHPAAQGPAAEGKVRNYDNERGTHLESGFRLNPITSGQKDTAVCPEGDNVTNETPSQPHKENTPIAYSQAELDKLVAAAIEKQNTHWEVVLDNKKSQHKRQKAQAKASNLKKLENATTALKLEADAKQAQRENELKAHWESVVDQKKKNHDEHIEQLRTANLQDREAVTKALKSEAEAKEAKLKCEAEVKQGMMEAFGQYWQQSLDKKSRELEEAKDSIDLLQSLLEHRHETLYELIKEAEKSKQLIESSFTIANDDFMTIYAQFDELERQHIALNDRYANLAADHNEATAQHQQRIGELEEELSSAQSCLQQLKREQKGNGVSRNTEQALETPSSFQFHAPNLQQPSSGHGASSSNNRNETHSQRAFPTQANRQSQQANASPAQAFLDGLPSQFSNLHTPHPRVVPEATPRTQYTYAPSQSGSFDFTANYGSGGPSSSEPAQPASTSESSVPSTEGTRTSRFQSIFDEQAARRNGTASSASGGFGEGGIR